MACLLPHTIDEIITLVEKLIEEATVCEQALIDLAVQFDKACEARDDLFSDMFLDLFPDFWIKIQKVTKRKIKCRRCNGLNQTKYQNSLLTSGC